MLRGHVFKFQTFASEVFAHFINTFLQNNMGITKGCELSNTTDSVTIGAGYFCIMGRFLEIIGSETVSNITEAGYYNLICEIDLSKINTKTELNQAVIKVIKSTSGYSTLRKDDLFEDGEVYQYEFARFRVNENGITDFTDKRTFLNLESLYSLINNNFNKLFEEKNQQAENLLEEIRQELASVVDGSAYLLKRNDIKIIEIPAVLEKGCSTSIHRSLPAGFTSSNCVILTYAININDTRRYIPIGIEVDWMNITKDYMDIYFSNIGSDTVKFCCKIVLMKLYDEELLQGDLDGDGVVSQNDLDILKSYVAGQKCLTDKQFKAADMNGDGIVNISDQLLLQREIDS